jgi:hypothetical protein
VAHLPDPKSHLQSQILIVKYPPTLDPDHLHEILDQILHYTLPVHGAGIRIVVRTPTHLGMTILLMIVLIRRNLDSLVIEESYIPPQEIEAATPHHPEHLAVE